MKTMPGRDRGFALLAVMAVVIIVASAAGAAVFTFRTTAVQHRHSIRCAEARSLAMGAWAAARAGIADRGAEYEGFEPRQLGQGRISVQVGKDGSGRISITAVGEVKGDHGPVFSVVTGTIAVDESGGNKHGDAIDMRME